MINNKIIKSFTFSNKGSAYSFFLHHLKDISFYYSTKNNCISAILYQKSNGRKKVLSKNLSLSQLLIAKKNKKVDINSWNEDSELKSISFEKNMLLNIMLLYFLAFLKNLCHFNFPFLIFSPPSYCVLQLIFLKHLIINLKMQLRQS